MIPLSSSGAGEMLQKSVDTRPCPAEARMGSKREGNRAGDGSRGEGPRDVRGLLFPPSCLEK